MSTRPLAAALALAALFAGGAAQAGPREAAQKGVYFAKRGECVKAIPFLEEAELANHRPSIALSLADCYVATGELVKASDLYHAIADEKPQRSWVRGDHNAQAAAKKKGPAIDARIPTLRVEPAEDYPELEVTLNGRALDDVRAEKRVSPDTSIEIVARAKGYRELRDKVVLNEGERLVLPIQLTREGPAKPPAPPPPKEKTRWLGARYRGTIFPSFLFKAFADGGTTVVSPGGGITFTTPAAEGTDIVVSIGYASFVMGKTPFKAKDTPDTEWEHVWSDMHALFATLDLVWSFPIDTAKKWFFRVGGGVGVGWTFLGDLHRVQVYPKNGKASDPATYAECRGPNNPKGTFRYCNALDKDAEHYGNFAEPDWAHGGIRPRVFPWLVLPELGISWRPSPSVMIDLEAGVSLTGIMTGLGVRFGL